MRKTKLPVVPLIITLAVIGYFLLNSEVTHSESSSATETVIIGKGPQLNPEPPSFRCDGGGNTILAPEAIFRPLTGAGKTNKCFEATAIIIHWSAQTSGHSNEATYNALKRRGLSCQYSTDSTAGPQGTWQMLEMFENKIEQSYCTGAAEYNKHGINIEIAGSNFDNEPALGPYNPPTPDQYNRTLDLVCFFKRQYNLPTSQIFGHYEVTPGKSDPGKKFLKKLRQDVENRCP